VLAAKEHPMLIENKELNAYAVIPVKYLNSQDSSSEVEFGFHGEEMLVWRMPYHILTEGYHYTHGGAEYRALCEWIVEEGKKAVEAEKRKRLYVRAKKSMYGGKKGCFYIGPFSNMAQALSYCVYFNEKPYECGPNESGRPDLTVVREDWREDAEPPDLGFVW
jgi:hypothetical protein